VQVALIVMVRSVVCWQHKAMLEPVLWKAVWAVAAGVHCTVVLMSIELL
jgi:hypothetical protein